MAKKIFSLILFIPGIVHVIPGIGYATAYKHNSIEIGAVFINQYDSETTWNSNKCLKSLSEQPESRTRTLPIVLFDLNINFGDRESLYLKTPLVDADDMNIALGIRKCLKNDGSDLDISFFFSPFAEAWKNPYLTDGNRQRTDVEKYGIKMACDNSRGTKQKYFTHTKIMIKLTLYLETPGKILP